MHRETFRLSKVLLIVIIAGLSIILLPDHFQLARATVPPFTFAAVGDFGQLSTSGSCATAGTTLSGSCAYNVVKTIQAQVTVPSFVLALGDLGYDAQRPYTIGASSGWCASFKNTYSGSVALVVGNHDTYNHANVHYTDGNPDITVTDSLTNEANNGFLDDLTGGVQGYVSACGAPSGTNWVGSGVTSNGGSCLNSLQSPSCYAREYYFDYPSSNPIMRFIIISAGICGAWFNAPQPCPAANGQPPTGANGWNPPTAPSTCASPPAGSEHYCWLKARIDEAKNAGLWVAVANHKECIMYSTNSCESTLNPFNLALTELGGVDLWLNGPDHTYQRTVQIGNTTDPCTVNGSFEVNYCHISGSGNGKPPSPYSRGKGTVVNNIGTGGGTLDTNICSSGCPINSNYFASLCGKNGVVSGLPQTAGCDAGGDYGFSTFTVDTTKIDAGYVSLGGFSDSYEIKVNNPSGDFSVYSPPVSVQRGVAGAPGSLAVNSFGAFSSSVSFTTSVVSGPTGTCPGSNCPVLTNPASITPLAGDTKSTALSVSSTTSTPCGNPNNSPGTTYSVTVTGTSGSTSHSVMFSIYMYGKADVSRDGIVDIVDLSSVGAAFGSVKGPPPSSNWNPNTDLDNSGNIDIVDLSSVAGVF